MKIRIAYDETNGHIPAQRWWPDGTVTIYNYSLKHIVVSMIDYWRIDLENDIILEDFDDKKKS